MGELNNIQNEIYLEMMDGDLGDVTKPFTGSRLEQLEFDPLHPRDNTIEVNYGGNGIFGLSFNVNDSQDFQIEMNDQKAILFKNYTSGTPKNQDTIVYDDLAYKIINHVVIPADNGWVLQLRAVSGV